MKDTSNEILFEIDSASHELSETECCGLVSLSSVAALLLFGDFHPVFRHGTLPSFDRVTNIELKGTSEPNSKRTIATSVVGVQKENSTGLDRQESDSRNAGIGSQSRLRQK